jgi:hypothetical protein
VDLAIDEEVLATGNLAFDDQQSGQMACGR